MFRTAVLTLLLGIGKITVAQPHGASVWLSAQLPVNFSKQWQWHNDFTYKSDGMAIKAYQRFYRTGIRYQFSPNWNAGGGIAFFSTQATAKDDEFGKEFRLWQELSYQFWLKKKLSFQNRFRTEERFLEATSQAAAYQILNLNDRVSFVRPVSEKWDIQFADEFFEQMIDRKLSFNQNRVIGAGIYNLTKSIQLQGAYIWSLRKTFSQYIIQFTIRKMFLAYGRHDHSGE